MAVNTSGISYYPKNVLRALGNWNILDGASYGAGAITISSGGMASVDLTNDYNNGLKASKYRRLMLGVLADIDANNNYENIIEVIIRCKYIDSDGAILTGYYSSNITGLGAVISTEGFIYDRLITMENYALESCTVYVCNKSGADIKLLACEMYRSQDINDSQIGEAIGFSIVLDKCIAYLDGCELYYQGIEKPDKIWWVEGSDGGLGGLNVNNERLIVFQRKQEILLD